MPPTDWHREFCLHFDEIREALSKFAFALDQGADEEDDFFPGADGDW